MTALIHPYASYETASLYRHIGVPIEIPEWKCWLLKRVIPETDQFDCIGSYPMLIIDRDANLLGGINRLSDMGIISVVFVTDTFTCPSHQNMITVFDYNKPFKTHFIYNTKIGSIQYNKHHRYEIKQALKQIEIRIISLKDYIEDWIILYQGLIQKHNIRGASALSKEALENLVNLNDITSIAAFKDNKMVSCHLWIKYQQYVYSFLAASNEEGYRHRASYAIYDAAIQYFTDVDMINFGGCAGAIDNVQDGLAKFKAGFSNDSKMSYVFGSVIKPETYTKLCGSNTENIHYFPAYRAIHKELK